MLLLELYLFLKIIIPLTLTEQKEVCIESEADKVIMKSSTHSSCKETTSKHSIRTHLPAELSRYSKSCKLLFDMLRDTKLIIKEINAADYLARGK